nr:lyso-ornithine lipid O-acyltransferase-like [Nerophis lumbriciformis]
MTTLRRLLRLKIIVLATLFSYCGLLVSWPWRQRAPARQLRWRNWIFEQWAGVLQRALGLRVECQGEPPEGDFFLVSNHQTYLDIIVLGSFTSASYVAKLDLRSWPVIGGVLRAADTIFVDRGRKRDLLRVMRLIDDSRARGLGVLLFPEGTTGRGDCVLPIKPSLLDYPARRSIPVHYVTLSYATRDPQRPAQEWVSWWGESEFGPHFWRLLKLPRIDVQVRFGEAPISDPMRKQLADRLHLAMSRQFESSD